MKLLSRSALVFSRLGWNLLLGGLFVLGAIGLGLAVFSRQAAGEGTFPVQLESSAGADYSSDPETFRFAAVQQGIWRDLPAVPTLIPATGTPFPALVAPLATATSSEIQQVKLPTPTPMPSLVPSGTVAPGVTRTPLEVTATPPRGTLPPSHTPDVTEEVDPGPSPTPAPSPTPTATPTPSATPTATPTPTPVPTLTPSLTPDPSPTSTPSIPPDPSPTPSSSSTSTPTPTSTTSPEPSFTSTPSGQEPTPPDHPN